MKWFKAFNIFAPNENSLLHLVSIAAKRRQFFFFIEKITVICFATEHAVKILQFFPIN